MNGQTPGLLKICSWFNYCLLGLFVAALLPVGWLSYCDYLIGRREQATKRLVEEIGGTIVRHNIDGYYIEAAFPNATDQTLTRFAELAPLQTLDLSGSNITDEGLRHLNKPPFLTAVILDDTGVGDTGVEHLRGFSGSVSLAGTKITDKALITLAGIPTVDWIDVSRTSISDEGILEFCGRITSKDQCLYDMLTLDNTQIGDSALSALAEADRFRVLSIRNTNVSDVGVAQLGSCRRLTSLTVNGTNVSNETITRLQERLPELRIER